MSILPTSQLFDHDSDYARHTRWYLKVEDRYWYLIGVEALVHLIDRFTDLLEVAWSPVDVEELSICA